MAESPWLTLDTKALAKSGSTSKEKGGVTIATSLSPYDVPEAARGYWDELLKRYVIEFRYIQEEAWDRRTEPHDSPITLRLGKNSCRLYAIEFDVNKLQQQHIRIPEEIAAQVTAALEKLSLVMHRPSRAGHYKVLQQAVDESETQLLEKLEQNAYRIAIG